MGILKNICISCSCNGQEAQEHLDATLRHLRNMRDLDDLRYSDFEDACSGLGLEQDFIEYFINQVAC